MEAQYRFRVDSEKLNRILADRKISSGAKLILLRLINRLGGKYYAFPSQKTIAKEVGLSERQVRNQIRVLRENGILTSKHGAMNPRTKQILNSNEYDLSQILIETF